MGTSTTAAERSSRTQLDKEGSNLHIQSSISLIPSAASYKHGKKKLCKSKHSTALQAASQENFYTGSMKLSSFHGSRGVVGQPSDGNKQLLTLSLVCLRQELNEVLLCLIET